MSITFSWELVRAKAKELTNKLQSAFPQVDVEYTDWVEMNSSPEKWASLQERGFPSPGIDVHAYVLIRGDLEVGEEAATFAENQVARIWDESRIVIQIRKTDQVWCKKSVMLEAQDLAPGQDLKKGPQFNAWEDEKGITFLCLTSKPHDHDFGRLQKQFLAISR